MVEERVVKVKRSERVDSRVRDEWSEKNGGNMT
jgi:hypothetical protein